MDLNLDHKKFYESVRVINHLCNKMANNMPYLLLFYVIIWGGGGGGDSPLDRTQVL